MSDGLFQFIEWHKPEARRQEKARKKRQEIEDWVQATYGPNLPVYEHHHVKPHLRLQEKP